MSKVSAYTSWQPLEEVIVGRAYTPDYFDFIEDTTVREQLQLILHQTNEDLDNLQKVCETYGAIVKRPDLPRKSTFIENQIDPIPGVDAGAPVPPLTPRDWQITLGDKLLRVLHVPELNDICHEYGDSVINPHGNIKASMALRYVQEKLEKMSGRDVFDPDCILNGASASCIVRCGTDVFFDNSDYLKPEQSRWIQENCLDSRYRFHEAITDGHGDAVFAILKPGVLLSSKWDDQLDLDADFPGGTVDDSGEIIANRIIDLMQKTNAPNGLSGVGFTQAHVNALADSSARQKRAIANTPQETNLIDIQNIYTNAIHYW